MRSAFATLALAALAAANPMPGGVSGSVTPSSGAPDGCSPNYAGSFKISTVNVSSSSYKRSVQPRDTGNTGLVVELHNGVLTDADGRTGYIASNSQFQFDNPPQAGAIYTAGFSVCSNGSLALGSDAIWYSCLSGNFYNLYDYNSGKQCFQVYLVAVGAGSSATTAPTGTYGSTTTTAPAASYGAPDTSAPEATTASTECNQIGDGQPQCSTVEPPAPSPSGECGQIGDGQPQCSTAESTPTPTSVCSQIGDGQAQCASASAAYPSPSSSYTGPAIAHGAANAFGVQREMFGLAAGVLAVAMF